tara:strand:- start:2578 stop:2805 length:228 start_codon:yes stop_codon:yes gene_type:complete
MEIRMRIRELINRLEEIEQCSEGKILKMVTTLIDDIIEHDIKMEKIMKRFSDDMEDDLIKHLITDGIKSGSVGEA